MAGAVLKPGSIGGLKTRKPSTSNANPTMFIYGSGGAGKTALAASACEVEEMCPVLHLNLEQGSQTIEHMYPNGDIDILDISNFKQFQDVFTELHQNDGSGYKTIIVDNLTEAQSMGTEYIMGTHEDSQDFSDFAGPTFANGGYARSTEQMRKVVRYFRGLPCYTIFIAWAKNYNEAGKKPDMKPAFTNTFGNEAPGLVNDLYYYTVRDGKRVLQTKKTDTVEAKDRTGTLPDVIIDPTMKTITDYWKGNLKKSDTPTESTTKTTGLKKRS